MKSWSRRSGGIEGQDDSDHFHRRSHFKRPIMSQMEAIKRSMVMQPPTFNGEPNAEAAEHWLRRMKRIMVGLDIPEEKRDIEETNQIREQRDDRKEKQRMGESSQKRSHGRSKGRKVSSLRGILRSMQEGLPIAGRTAGSTSISGKFSAIASSAFPAPSVSVALLPNATFTPSNAGSQDSYHE
ncbi:hypothetical protein CK203_055337 [Vitis vinifera]|uniref:Retrotransposon gag domain-containing protein n=1 Tax=Vitis vinifera TaxID=29760 RepID=A0A438GSZ2_VITVI|nr:hypothetical protein CK203_055337 [Vitis vinifera]